MKRCSTEDGCFAVRIGPGIDGKRCHGIGFGEHDGQLLTSWFGEAVIVSDLREDGGRWSKADAAMWSALRGPRNDLAVEKAGLDYDRLPVLNPGSYVRKQRFVQSFSASAGGLVVIRW